MAPTETEKVISNTDDNYKIATVRLQNIHILKYFRLEKVAIYLNRNML